MNTVINNDVANRLHEISTKLTKSISADTEGVRRLRDIAKEIMSLANSLSRCDRVCFADVWPKELSKEDAEHHLIAEDMPNTVMVAVAEILGAKDPCARNRAEDAKVKDKDQLVTDRHPGHLRGPNPPDHNVIQHIDKVGNAVLDHNGQRQSDEGFIEFFIAK
jgi:hypothetical protein